MIILCPKVKVTPQFPRRLMIKPPLNANPHRMHSYFMGFSIERIASKSGKVTYEQKKTEGTPDVSGTLDQLKKGITDGLFMNLIELQRKFEAMTRILITRGSDPNFWGPTAG